MAEKKFFVDLNLNKNALKSAALENVAVSGVTSPASGQIAFDTASSKMAFYNGASWEVVGQLAVDTVNYKGGVGHDGSVATPDNGDMYIFTTAGTATNFGGGVVQAGDFAIYSGSAWDVIQKNIEAASTTVAGYVELATSEETITGTDTVRAVTPAGLKAWQDQADKTVVRKKVFTSQTISTTPNSLSHDLGASVAVTVYDTDGYQIEVGVQIGNGTVVLVANSSIAGCKVVIEG